MIATFAKADALQTFKFTAIIWVSVALIYVGRSAFRPSADVLISWLLFLPVVLIVVFVARLAAFTLRYFANDKDFALTYAKFRANGRNSSSN